MIIVIVSHILDLFIWSFMRASQSPYGHIEETHQPTSSSSSGHMLLVSLDQILGHLNYFSLNTCGSSIGSFFWQMGSRALLQVVPLHWSFKEFKEINYSFIFMGQSGLMVSLGLSRELISLLLVGDPQHELAQIQQRPCHINTKR